MGSRIVAALFAEGRLGQENFHGVWGGLRFYFGQKDKTLIRRNREDDPADWGTGIGGTSNGGSSTPGPTGSGHSGGSGNTCPPLC
jgi:hypothetical protein